MQLDDDSGKYAFVVMTKASKPDAKGRTLMRKHVMKPHGKARRKPRSVAIGTSDERYDGLKTPSAPHSSQAPSSLSSSDKIYQTGRTPASDTSSRICSSHAGSVSVSEGPKNLATWESSPWPAPQAWHPESSICRSFSIYPVRMNSWAYEAVDHMLRRPLLPPRLVIYRMVWFPLALIDPAAFRQVLASYATHRYAVESVTPEKTMHAVLESNSQAMRSVRERIGTKPTSCDLSGLICAMTAMACHAHLNGDLWQWKNHLKAIRCVLEPLGGLDTHMLSAQLRKLVQWVEIIGCYVLDEAPVLALPLRIPTEARSSQWRGSPRRLTGALVTYLPQTSDLTLAVGAVVMLTDVESTSSDPRQAEPDYDSALHDRINRIVCSLLCFGNPATQNVGLDLQEELIRTGALLYLAKFRRHCGDAPVITSTHVEQLRRNLSRLGAGPSSSYNSSLELWLTVLGALEAMSIVHKSMFEGRLAVLLALRSFSEVEQLEAELYTVVWHGRLYAESLRALFKKCSGCIG